MSKTLRFTAAMFAVLAILSAAAFATDASASARAEIAETSPSEADEAATSSSSMLGDTCAIPSVQQGHALTATVSDSPRSVDWCLKREWYCYHTEFNGDLFIICYKVCVLAMV